MPKPLRTELSTLWFALPSLSVYLVAVALLELGGLTFATSLEPVRSTGSFEKGLTTALMGLNHARVSWLSSVLLFYVSALAALVISFATLRSALSTPALLAFSLIGAALCIGGIWHFWASMLLKSDLSLIFRFTFESLSATERFSRSELTDIARLIGSVNVLAAVVTFFLMLGGCCVLSPLGFAEKPDPRPDLQQRMANLKRLVNLGSGTLVAGALHMLLWMRWPIAISQDSELRTAIGDWALGVTLYSGIAYSLMLAALYIPCAHHLYGVADRTIRAKLPELTDEERNAWLEQHGFSAAIWQQIPQIVATLAPIFAGPIGSAVSGLGAPIPL